MANRVDAGEVTVGESRVFVHLEGLDYLGHEDGLEGQQKGGFVGGMGQLADRSDERGIGGVLEGRRLDFAEPPVVGVHLKRGLPNHATDLTFEFEVGGLRKPPGEQKHRFLRDESVAIEQSAIGVDGQRGLPGRIQNVGGVGGGGRSRHDGVNLDGGMGK